jgi:endonuclease-8
MPEGPEIRRAADELANALEGKSVHLVRFGLPKLRHHARKLRDHRVTAVETRGKALLTHFEHGYSIYSHNQLYGIWKVVKGHKLPKTNRSLRLLLQTDTHSAILYSASDISVWATDELDTHPFLKKIGPDIMNKDLHWRDVAKRLSDPQFASKSLASLYLDQAFLAGNGNYLRSEILHDAGLHHMRQPGELTKGEIGRLARSTLTLSSRSYQTGGITLATRLAKSFQSQGLSFGQRRFYVFGRTGRPCYHCSQEIERREIGGRRLYLCSNCQPE